MRIACNIYRDLKIVGLRTAINMLPLQVATHIPTVPTQKQGVVCRGFRQQRIGYIVLSVKEGDRHREYRDGVKTKIENGKKKKRRRIWC
jgi:hypothetical protein